MFFGSASGCAQDFERARYEALRRRVFGQMARSGLRWRLIWKLPFHVAILAVLATRGESEPRLWVQVSVTAIYFVLMAASVWVDAVWFNITSFVASFVGFFLLLATTGGLASPLLITGALTMVVTAITQRDPSWLRPAAFVSAFTTFVGLAILSPTPLGELPVPLKPIHGWPSPEYVLLTLMSAVFTLVGIYRVGCATTQGYERAALEAAERREELCSENEDRSRALEAMAARLAHEVKNPLAAIKGLSTHMARNATDPKAAERLAIVAGEADRLQSIVDGFLSFSRGLDDLRPAPTNLFDVAYQLTVLLETRAQDAEITLAVGGDRDVVVVADARHLRQALLNVVLNAIQASPRGSSVEIDVGRVPSGARLVVTDHGVGMTPDVLERIRKPYFTTKEGGTGLGVAVARGLVEQHGGRLELQSAAGKGTTATLVLPLTAKCAAALPKPKEPRREGAEPSSIGRTKPALIS